MIIFDFEKIEKSLAEKGVWEMRNEWRIFTDTTFWIAKVEELDSKNQTKRTIYAVKVSCDYEFRCECPTLRRAVEFCKVFQNWIEDGFSKHGWPSWVEKTKPK